MRAALCIHGHFYQPPREDPWLGAILSEGGAAPMNNWNERILRQSYAPIAWARRVDGSGRITDIVNCYEWMNFNAGPTLLRWMRDASPETLRRMQEADARSLARWGRGNAVAQVYHHIIMPLATAEERALETRWAVDDFIFHFGRAPEGMWLSECAVDLPSLDALAAEGINYVILAPGQAKALVRNGKAAPIDEGSLNIGEPYFVKLPSGRTMTVVFYNGSLSRRTAFDGLPRDGEFFWKCIVREAEALVRRGGDMPLLTLATDGETYGHHFVFGEMALAYVLAQGYAGRDGIRLTNLAAYLAATRPVREVLLHEPSAWSCVHGVERWRSDCGCRDGGHDGWNQAWRGPLREALHIMRAAVSRHFHGIGSNCFNDPAETLSAYGTVLADPTKSDGFAASRFTRQGLENDLAWKLLDMQEQSLAALASCAWFFDDIARIEPENAMSFALRAMELLRECGGPDIRGAVLDVLEKAVSNQPGEGTGKDIFEREITARRSDPATLCLVTWASTVSGAARPALSDTVARDWPKVRVELRPEEETGGTLRGTAVIRRSFEKDGRGFAWLLKPWSAVMENPFVPLAEAAMRVASADAGLHDVSARAVGDLSRPMLDSLLTFRLENAERERRPALAAAALHAASALAERHEERGGLPEPHLWLNILPYMVAECMTKPSCLVRGDPGAAAWNAAVPADALARIRGVLAALLTPEAKRFASRLACDALLDSLRGTDKGPPAGDAELARQARVARELLPDITWWELQNEVWERGLGTYPLLAAELGFSR
ncbi:MAG: DUF3536 domain-containing protein [Desulfovibrio sp.]|nr:DUF3536 domain-containing protein [Desulfovibrio sp.]